MLLHKLCDPIMHTIESDDRLNFDLNLNVSCGIDCLDHNYNCFKRRFVHPPSSSKDLEK